MSKLRKTFLVTFILFVICILALTVPDRNSSPIWLRTSILIICLVYFHWLIPNFRKIFDDFFPTHIPEGFFAPLNGNRIYYYTITPIVMICVFIYLEAKYFDNTIHGLSIFWIAGISGIILALIVIVMINRINPLFHQDKNRRLPIYLSIIISLFTFLPVMVIFLNHTFANQHTECKAYKTLSQYESDRQFFFSVRIDGRAERIEADYNVWNYAAGDSVILCMKKGLLRFDFIDEIRPLH